MHIFKVGTVYGNSWLLLAAITMLVVSSGAKVIMVGSFTSKVVQREQEDNVMGDIGMSEVLVLAVVMLLVMGPEQMVRMMREAGRWLRRVQKMANNMRIVLVDELEKIEQAARPDGTLPGTGGAKNFSDIVGNADDDKAIGQGEAGKSKDD